MMLGLLLLLSVAKKRVAPSKVREAVIIATVWIFSEIIMYFDNGKSDIPMIFVIAMFSLYFALLFRVSHIVMDAQRIKASQLATEQQRRSGKIL